MDRLAAGCAQTGQFDPAGVSDVERQHRLLQAYEQCAPPRPARRPSLWLIGPIFAITVIVVALLLFMRVNSTEIMLDLQASSVAFTVTEAQNLNETFPVRRISLNGIDKVLLPPGVQPFGDTDEGNAGAARTAAAALDAAKGQAIVLQPIVLPAGTRVRIGPPGAGETVNLSLFHLQEPITLSVTVPRRFDLTTLGAGAPVRLDLDRPRPVQVLTAPGEVFDITVTPAEAGRELFRTELPVSALSFHQIKDVEGTTPQVLSTVTGGALFLEALDGKRIDLRTGEHLGLDLTHGVLATLAVEKGGVALRANGWTRALTVGSRDNARNLMPRWLEWLKSRYEVALFWGTASYLFMVLWSAVKWWGLTR
ncbi:MAG: hypothetical protein WAS73_00595 [Defluviicoccus sp.]